LKIGIILDDKEKSENTDFFLKNIRTIEYADVHLLVNCFTKETKFGIFRKLTEYGVKKFIAKSIFSFTSGRPFESNRDLSESKFDQFGNPALSIFPIRSLRNSVYSYSKREIDEINSLNLDLILRSDGRGILKGEILSAAKFGVVSIHYSDNRKIRGGPPGFWEIYLKQDKTGYTIQILNEKIDSGDVIGRGEHRTISNYSRNRDTIATKANSHMIDILRDFCDTGNLPEPEPKTSALGKVYSTPSIKEQLLYLFLRKSKAAN